MKQTILILLILLLPGFINALYADTETHQANPAVTDEKHLVIEGAWIAEAPPVSKVMVAYMIINNTGPEDIDIILAESEWYSSIEFHETVHENGMARMIRHGSLNIPANNRLELKRGGPHMMLFNPKQPLKAGNEVIIKLTTGNNTSKTVRIPVKKAHFN